MLRTVPFSVAGPPRTETTWQSPYPHCMQAICNHGPDDGSGLISGCWYCDDPEVPDLYVLIVTLEKRRYMQIIAAHTAVLMEPTTTNDIVRKQNSGSRNLRITNITCLFASAHFSSALSLSPYYYFLIHRSLNSLTHQSENYQDGEVLPTSEHKLRL